MLKKTKKYESIFIDSKHSIKAGLSNTRFLCISKSFIRKQYSAAQTVKKVLYFFET